MQESSSQSWQDRLHPRIAFKPRSLLSLSLTEKPCETLRCARGVTLHMSRTGSISQLMRCAVGATAAAIASAAVFAWRLHRRSVRSQALVTLPEPTSVPAGVSSRLDEIAPRTKPSSSRRKRRCRRGQIACDSANRYRRDMSSNDGLLDDDCTFCLDALTAKRAGDIRITPCGHAFHAGCLEQWVYHRADTYLDWRNYTLAEDGHIEGSAQPPSCPNCGTALDVISSKELKLTLLKTIARALSLRDLSTAADIFDSGLVHHPLVDSEVTRIPHQIHSEVPSRHIAGISTTRMNASILSSSASNRLGMVAASGQSPMSMSAVISASSSMRNISTSPPHVASSVAASSTSIRTPSHAIATSTSVLSTVSPRYMNDSGSVARARAELAFARSPSKLLS